MINRTIEANQRLLSEISPTPSPIEVIVLRCARRSGDRLRLRRLFKLLPIVSSPWLLCRESRRVGEAWRDCNQPMPIDPGVNLSGVVFRES